MNVLIIIHNRVNTGPYFKVLEMCKALTRLNIRITLVCTSFSDKLSTKYYLSDSVRVIETPDLFNGKLRQGFDLWNALNRYLVLRRQKFDLIHAIDCRPVVIMPSLVLKRRYHVPLIISWWDYFSRDGTIKERSGLIYNLTLGFIEQFFNHRFRRFADYSIAISSYLYNKLKELGISEEYIDVIKLGSVSLKIGNQNKHFLRDNLKLPKNKVVFVYMGTMYKNDMDLLLESLKIYFKQHGENIVTILIGHHNIDDSLCKKLSIVKTGFINDNTILNKYLISSDYGLLPLKNNVSNISRWPSKAADYWAMGLPTICSPVGELIKLFKDYNFGYMSKSDSPLDFAKCINTAVLGRYDPKQYDSKLNSINKLLNNELSWDLIAKKHLFIYKSRMME